MKFIDQIFIDKALQAEESQMVNVIQAAHTRSVVGNHSGQTLRILLMVSGLIEINQQERIIIAHILSISFLFSCFADSLTFNFIGNMLASC